MVLQSHVKVYEFNLIIQPCEYLYSDYSHYHPIILNVIDSN